MQKKLRVSFHKPSLFKEEEKAVVRTLRSGWITTGPSTAAFEKAFAEYTGAGYALGVNSCTAALHLALVAAGIKKGDEVITSPITFPATANVVIHQNATPVFSDVLPDSLNIDPAKIEEKITPRTKAIIPVHFAGNPCEMDEIMKIARRHNLTVIEDAAHAIGTVYKNKKVGAISDMTCFSFYATKNITTGEGGMLTTGNKNLADKIAVLRLHGISRDAWNRYGPGGYHHWESFYAGYKYNMFDIQAAIGLVQMKRISAFWRRRKQIVNIYNEAFSGMPGLQPLKYCEGGNSKSAYHLYVILLKLEKLKASRDAIMNEIQNNGVGIGIHFRALHLQKYYRERYGFRKGILPEAEKASDSVLSLPLYPGLADSDVKTVIRAVKKVFERFTI